MKAPGCETRAAFASACIVALYAILAFDGADAIYPLWYYTPAAMVAGSLAADRFKSERKNRMTWMMDCLITLLCISRPLLGWPAASGHALFFVYALLTASSPSTRIFALILGGVTLYAKIVLWHWDATLWPGLGIGLVAGYLYLRIQKTAISF